MSSTTAHLGLTIPDDSDPVSGGAAAIRALGNGIDSKLHRGQATANTDASGDVTINHGLGVVPTCVVVSNGNSGLTVTTAPHTFTTTTFKVRYRASTTGAAVGAGASVITNWIAIA